MKNKMLKIGLVVLNLIFICFNQKVIFAASSLEPVKIETKFEIYDNKEEFENFYRDKIDLTTGNETQRDLVLNNIFKIQNFLRYLDVDIKIIDREEMVEVAKEFNTNSFSGLYNPKSKELYLVGYDTDTSIHELGHAVYYQILDGRERNMIDAQFNLEKAGLLDEYGMTNKEEFFAVAFVEYVYIPEQLSKDCPNTYNFFKSIEDKINK